MKVRLLGFFSFIVLLGILGAGFYLNATSKEGPIVSPPKDEESIPLSKEEESTSPSKEEQNTPSISPEMFNAILERVMEDYVEPVSEDKLFGGALNGMLSSLDPHSSYLDPKAYAELKSQTKGEFGGLGLEVIMENGLVKIISPIDDTPAQEAELQAGDLIVGIDKKPVFGMNLIEAVDLMRGKPGTKVRLHIKREGKDVFEKVLTRALIKIKAVKWHAEGNVGYIRIATFNDEKTTVLVKEAVEDLKKKLGKKLEGIILDVRNNPGGLFDTAIGVSNLFLAKGQEIVSTKGRSSQMDSRTYADATDILKGLPIVVLINGGSASSSEIVAGALKDNHRAIVAGTKSFGKGSVQLVLPLVNEGALKLTVARYYTPSGISIQDKGNEPNIVIDQAQAKLEKIDEEEGRLYEEDIRGALDTTKDKLHCETKEEQKEEDDLDPDSKKKKKEIEDYQLMRAIDIVRTMYLTKRYFVKGTPCQ